MLDSLLDLSLIPVCSGLMASSSGEPLCKKTRMTEQDSRTTEHQKQKQSKVMQVLNIKGTSNRTLHFLANKLAAEDEQTTWHSFQKMSTARFTEVKRVIVLPLEGGWEHHWEVTDPSLLIVLCVRLSTQMEEIFANSLRLHPCSEDRPWSLVLAWDEFTPGTLLKPHNERKAMTVCISFRELVSNSDNTWWTIAVTRTHTIKQVQGGWSKMLRELLRLSLGGPSGMQTAGIPIKVNGELLTIYARVVCLLSDGDGLRQALQWNGAASLKPCFRHWNVLMKDHTISKSSDKYVAIDCCTASRFQVWSEHEWRTCIDVCVWKPSDSGLRAL